MKIFKCPFSKELKNGTMVCDSGYCQVDLPECPTEIFNKCQAADRVIFGSKK